MSTVPQGWHNRSIRYFLSGVIDYRGKTPPSADSGIPVLTAAHVKQGSVQHCGEKFVSREVYERWTTRGFIRPGDVLITTEAPVAEVARVPDDRTYLITRRVMSLQVDSTRGDERFLMYSLLWEENQRRLETYSHGTTVPRLYKDDILDFNILTPPLEVQVQVGCTLGRLDQLIKNNTRRIEILEEMVQTIYREWFVNFHFPDHEDVEMVESELGLIPEGWQVDRLGNQCRLTLGQSPKSEFYNEERVGLPFHQGVTDFGDRFPTHRVYCTKEKRVAEKGDILFSVRAPVGRINIAPSKMVIGRGLHAIRANDGHQEFLYQQLKDRFREEDSMGSGTIFKSVRKSDMLGLELLVPPKSHVAAFEEMVAPMVTLVTNLTKANVVLRGTRDLLLPKLVSGQIFVEDTDSTLEEAVA